MTDDESKAETAHGADGDAFSRDVSALLHQLRDYDGETCRHSQSVGSWARRIAESIGLSSEDVRFVERCALLHDIGKLRTPSRILLKPGPLTAVEWRTMKQHAAEGAALLLGIPALAEYAIAAGAHHERHDGRGYPFGLSGEAIPLATRITSVADAFDAMIGQRPYRVAIAPREALEEIRRCRGSQFDPQIVEALVALVEEPKRSRLRKIG